MYAVWSSLALSCLHFIFDSVGKRIIMQGRETSGGARVSPDSSSSLARVTVAVPVLHPDVLTGR